MKKREEKKVKIKTIILVYILNSMCIYMTSKARFNSNIDETKPLESDNVEPLSQQPSKRSSIPTIAGFILIIAGVLAIFNWIQIFSLDSTTLESFVDITQIRELYPSITYEQLLEFFHTCAIIGMIISIFPILGGLLAIQRKLFFIAVAGSIIGLFSIGILFSSSVLSLIGLILLIISRQKFQ